MFAWVMSAFSKSLPSSVALNAHSRQEMKQWGMYTLARRYIVVVNKIYNCSTISNETWAFNHTQHKAYAMKLCRTHSKKDALYKLAPLKLQYRTMLCWKATPFRFAPRRGWVGNHFNLRKNLCVPFLAAIYTYVHIRMKNVDFVSNIAKWNVILGWKLSSYVYGEMTFLHYYLWNPIYQDSLL